jgi:signal transduction histidine kinase
MEFVQTLAMRSSHELKNALVSIKTFTQLLPKKYKSESFRKDFFNVVGKEVDHLNSLVEDLLFFSHPVTLYKEKQDFSAIIKRVSADISKEYKGVSVKSTYGKDISVFIECDEKNISIALHNILKNSVQAMKGKGTITLSLDTGRGNDLILTIRDQGAAIPDDIRKKMFEPFFTTKIKGLGLGLTIARKIFESHGWLIEPEEKVPHCGFRIMIPSQTGARDKTGKAHIVFDRFKDRLLEHNH